MTPLAAELDTVLSKLDSETAALLETAVRDALALAQHRVSHTRATDAFGYPLEYFETTAGSFVNEPLEVPPDLPMEVRESW